MHCCAAPVAHIRETQALGRCVLFLQGIMVVMQALDSCMLLLQHTVGQCGSWVVAGYGAANALGSSIVTFHLRYLVNSTRVYGYIAVKQFNGTVIWELTTLLFK